MLPTHVKITTQETMNPVMRAYWNPQGDILSLASWAGACGYTVPKLIETLQEMERNGDITAEWFREE